MDRFTTSSEGDVAKLAPNNTPPSPLRLARTLSFLYDRSTVIIEEKEEDVEEIQLRKSSTRLSRGSSITSVFVSAFSGSKILLSLEGQRLEALCMNSEAKNRLINTLLAEEGNVTVKLRFFGACADVLHDPDRAERARKKHALAKIFFQSNNGFFSIAGLPTTVVQEICAQKTGGVARAQKLVGEDLLRNLTVARAVESFHL